MSFSFIVCALCYLEDEYLNSKSDVTALLGHISVQTLESWNFERKLWIKAQTVQLPLKILKAFELEMVKWKTNRIGYDLQVPGLNSRIPNLSATHLSHTNFQFLTFLSTFLSKKKRLFSSKTPPDLFNVQSIEALC